VSSSQVPLWVTVLISFVGLLGVLSAQLIAAWREDRRWRRDQDREELRWRRDRQRELENRDFEGRRDAYAQIMSALEAFDWLVYPVIKAFRRDPDLPATDVADVRQAREELRHSLGSMYLYAPQRFTDLIRRATLSRSDLAMELISEPDREPDRERVEQMWDRAQTGSRLLRVEMRADLGMDAETLPAGWVYDLSVKAYRQERAGEPT
jgi:hypothetical protein